MVKIEVKNVWYQYLGAGDWVLKDVTLVAQGGEAVLVTGHNGSGKTTLLKIASLIYRPASGKVLVDGVDFWGLSESEKVRVRRRIAYVHEKPLMLRGSVLHNIMYGLTLRGVNSEEATRKSREVLEELDMWERRSLNTAKLSTGQAQLVAIARALALEPEAIVLDEPFAHLDSRKREMLASTLVKRQNRGACIVISSHQATPSGTLKINKIITLENGRLNPEESSSL